MCLGDNITLSSCGYLNSTEVAHFDPVAYLAAMNADYSQWISDGFENKLSLYNIIGQCLSLNSI